PATLFSRSCSSVCSGTHSSLKAIRYVVTVISSQDLTWQSAPVGPPPHLLHERQCSHTTRWQILGPPHPSEEDRRYRMRRPSAQAVSSCREESCSLRSTEETCVSTVLTEMNSSLATSLY